MTPIRVTSITRPTRVHGTCLSRSTRTGRCLAPSDVVRACCAPERSGQTCLMGRDMPRGHRQRTATVGVAEHGNSAVLMAVAAGGELLDRRRIELTDRSLPTHPHHHEGSWAVGRYLNTPGARALSLAEAVALVERV